ncbi:hypothetical protein ACQJBY_063041 [Aegilops geniculata]
MPPRPKRRDGASFAASLRAMARHDQSRRELHDRPQSPLLPDSLAVPTNAEALQEPDPDVSSLEQLFDSTSLKESSVTTSSSSSLQAEAVAHDDTIVVSPPQGCFSPGPPITSRRPYNWAKTFIIRTDRGGSFHIYPCIGGPFQSLQEVDSAINRHLDDLRDKNVCLDEMSWTERVTRRALYRPDGTRKKLSKSSLEPERLKHTRLLVEALLDKYNEDHNRLGNLAYELKDIVCIQSVCEGSPKKYDWYYHLNFTARTKGDYELHSGTDNLFFAEVTRLGGPYKDFALSCFYMLKPNDNGQCRGCTHNKRVDLKHPNNADEYTGGHLDPYLPYGGDTTVQDSGPDENLDPEEEEAKLQAKEEARLKRIYKCLDDPKFLEKMRRRFKDDPRAEAFFQPQKRRDAHHGTQPLAAVQ